MDHIDERVDRLEVKVDATEIKFARNVDLIDMNRVMSFLSQLSDLALDRRLRKVEARLGLWRRGELIATMNRDAYAE